MARRYYRRRTVVVKPKKKWATNMVEIGPTYKTENNRLIFYQKLCENSAQTGNPTPVILKTGNFKLQVDGTFSPTTGAPVSFVTYVVYVPEGVLPAPNAANFMPAIIDLISKHPEWVLAWRYSSNDFINTSGPGNVDSVKVSSRLKRNLNSGDSIYFFGIATTSGANTFNSADCRGVCQYWTCAN